jgi:uncharacterized repeat protein (TIGR01451 family)
LGLLFIKNAAGTSMPPAEYGIGLQELTSPKRGTFRASVFFLGENSITSDAIAHEIGHTLGMSHAGSVSCVPMSLADPVNSCGSWSDSGDASDTMGTSSNYQHFSSPLKYSNSWLDLSQIQDVTASGEYTLDQIELPSGGAKALRIPLGKDSTGAETYYWVEYRMPGLFDTEPGIQVRYQPRAFLGGYSMVSNTLRFTGPAVSTGGGGGGSISGRVLSEISGMGVTNAGIQLYDKSGKYLQYKYTGSGGHYVFSGLSAGDYLLQTYNNYEGLVNVYYKNSPIQSTATPVTVATDKETPNIDFVLAPGSMVSGTITLDSDGKPIQSVFVSAEDSSGRTVSSGYTDSLGHYYIQGLPAGQYFFRASFYGSSGYGYPSRYYINAQNRTMATSVSLGSSEKLGNIDISLISAGAISGQVLDEVNKAPIQSAYVYAYDSGWNYLSGVSTSADGRYTLRNLPAGSTYMSVFKQGYNYEYYKDASLRNNATAIQVAESSETTGIDFLLNKTTTAPLGLGGDRSSHNSTGPVLREKDFPRDLKALDNAPGSSDSGTYQANIQPEVLPAPDVTSAAPFVDPYRGVKIELIQSAGSGAKAQAKVNVTLSKLMLDQAHSINFDQLSIHGRQAKELTMTNQNSTSVVVGAAIIQGTSANNFSISKDACSGTTLAPGKSCKIEIAFSPESYSGNTAGEFAVLLMPTNDSLTSVVAVDLWGTVLTPDLAYDGYSLSSNLTVGQTAVYTIYLYNAGNVRYTGVATIKDALPQGLRFISASGYGWNCSAAGQEVTCTKSVSLSPGYSDSLQLTVMVTAEAAPVCTNRVTVLSDSDPNSENNYYAITSSVSGAPTASFGANFLKEGDIATGIGLYNAGTATAALSLTALDKSGAALQLSGVTNPVTRVLRPGEQLPILDSELWGISGDQKSKMNWFKVDSSTQRVFGFELAFDSSLQVLDGAALSRFPMNKAILPDIVTRDFTRVYIVNPNTSSISLTIELVSADGNVRAAAYRNLAHNASLLESISELFTSTAAVESDYIRITGDGGFIALECMGMTGRWIKILSAQDSNEISKVLYASQYVTGGDYWRTSISIVNLDPASGQISARLIDNSGKQLGQTVRISIKAYGKIILNTANLFLDPGNELTGYVEISSDSLSLAGSVTFGDQGNTICAALPLQTPAYRELVFGHVASNSTWYTGFAVVNPNTSDVTAKYEVLDKRGNVVGSKTEVIKAGERKIGLLNQFFPTVAAADIGSGYIRVSGDSPLAGFALFGTTNSSVLSAIPSFNIR